MNYLLLCQDIPTIQWNDTTLPVYTVYCITCLSLSSPLWIIVHSQLIQFLKGYWKIPGTILVIELVAELRSDFKYFGSIDLTIFL